MSLQQEIKAWRKSFSSMKTEGERAEFKRKLHATLAERNEAELATGLVALRDFAKEVRLNAEKNASPALTFQVFPSNKQDIEFLSALLERMNIRYECSWNPFHLGIS